jgi:SAM-dependent methyltransferase
MSDRPPELLKHMLTGPEYVKYITSSAPDRRARMAFRDLVSRIATPGSRLFDFGAGTGLDAKFFAERGFTIDAYDVDPRMRECFAEYCRSLIDSGGVSLDCSSYPEFVSRRTASARQADLVISNFAPLNLVEDLHELFAKFHALTAPNGKILAGVLNPCFFGDMRLRWWWQSLPQLWRSGHFFMPGPQAPHYRRRLSNFSALSSPYFKLARVFRGLPARGGRITGGADYSRDRGFAWLRAIDCRYVFLLFEKCN